MKSKIKIWRKKIIIAHQIKFQNKQKNIFLLENSTWKSQIWLSASSNLKRKEKGYIVRVSEKQLRCALICLEREEVVMYVMDENLQERGEKKLKNA